MERNEGSVAPWRLFDGSIALTLSMLLAVLLRLWEGAANWPVVGTLHRITQWEEGVIIVATLLLFPTALALYGGFKMFFAAKEAVQRQAMRRGQKVERERIRKVLAERGMPLTPEQVQALDSDGERS